MTIVDGKDLRLGLYFDFDFSSTICTYAGNSPTINNNGMFFYLIPSIFLTMISISQIFLVALGMLTGSMLNYVLPPGSDMLACHCMLELVADPYLVDHHYYQLLPKHVSHFVFLW